MTLHGDLLDVGRRSRSGSGNPAPHSARRCCAQFLLASEEPAPLGSTWGTAVLSEPMRKIGSSIWHWDRRWDKPNAYHGIMPSDLASRARHAMALSNHGCAERARGGRCCKYDISDGEYYGEQLPNRILYVKFL